MFQLHLFINYEITKILTFKIRVYILKCFFTQYRTFNYKQAQNTLGHKTQ